MYTVFSDNNKHQITEANINFYAHPFVHPRRNLAEHDFIYILQGEWKFGQNDEEFLAKKDDVLLLSAYNTHFGILPCLPNTKTMYFHASCEAGDSFCDLVHPTDDDSVLLGTLIDASRNRQIKNHFSSIVNNKLHGKQKQADTYFDLLLYELADNHLYTEGSGVALQIKNLIHNNPETFFSNQELANLTRVSLKTAENKFKEQFGVTIHQYILNLIL